MSYRVSNNDLYYTASKNMNKIRYGMDKIVQKTGADNVYNSFVELGIDRGIRTSINLSTENQRCNAYIKNSAIALVKIDSTLASVTQLYNVAFEVERSLVVAAGNMFFEFDQTQNVANLALSEIYHILNANVDGSYIFAGSEFSNPAVNNLQSPNFSTEANGDIDYRHAAVTTDYYCGDDIRTKVILADNLVLPYGIQGDDPCFADLIAALHLVRKSTEDYDLLDRAQVLLRQSMYRMLELEQKLKNDYALVDKYQRLHSTIKVSLAEIQEGIDRENGVDITNLVAQYAANESLLSAAEYMFAKMNKLSILDRLT